MFVGPNAWAESTLQPFASFWTPDTGSNSLLEYDYSEDPDAPFNVGGVPLATRVTNPAYQANPNARSGEARVLSIAAFDTTSGNPSQGSDDARYYAFSHWQYVDALVFWGGSASEGNILAPNAPVIDAAHRNGVPVYGTVFLPPAVFGGEIVRLSDLVQQSSDGSFPLADKLIDIARRNRFDGWFINQETEGASPQLAAQTREFLAYLQSKSDDLEIVWYDAMVESGAVSWQGALNESNDGYFQETPTSARTSDSMLLDFRWSPATLAGAAGAAAARGRSQYELYAGVNVEGAGWNQTGEPLDQIFPDGQSHRTSVGFYRPEWTERSSSGVEDFHRRDTLFWSGANSDPSDTSGSVGDSGWKGVSNYVPAKSPITNGPFVTSFNLGHGHDYWVDGEIVRSGGWNNLGLQDVTPTWRWRVESQSTALEPEFDFTDAFHGGSSLRVSGELDGVNLLRLYMASLPVSEETNLQIAFKTTSPASGSNMAVALSFDDAPNRTFLIPVGDSLGADWQIRGLPLGVFAGRTISQIGLHFDGADPDYDINVGRLAIIEGEPDIPAAPTNLTLLDYDLASRFSAVMRLAWEHSTDYRLDASNSIYYYHLYKVSADGGRTFLGGTANNFFYVRDLPRSAQDVDEVKIEVVAIGNEFGVSLPSSFVFDWTRTPTGLQGDFNNDGVVDAADYTLWRDSLGGEAGLLANNPYPESVGARQYQIWREHFGESLSNLSGLSTAITTPEPHAAGTLGFLLAVGLTATRRRSRSEHYVGS
ncbi:MAG: glycoside hydrolase [Planctomycetota bacterium]